MNGKEIRVGDRVFISRDRDSVPVLRVDPFSTRPGTWWIVVADGPHNGITPYFSTSVKLDEKKLTTMKQKITETHTLDQNGNPYGGATFDEGISIRWQEGPLGRGADRQEPNGAFVEDIVQAAIGRLNFYQSSKFACRENAIALTHLETALLWLQARTADREARDVEGTHTP